MKKGKLPLFADTPVKYVKGIGPKRAMLLRKLGVQTVEDLLYIIPRKYMDLKKPDLISSLKPGEKGSVFGRVLVTGIRHTRTKGDVVQIVITDGRSKLTAVWFHRPDLRYKFKKGDLVVLSGEVRYYRGYEMINPLYEIISDKKQSLDMPRIIPIYPLTEGLSIWDIRRAIKNALEKRVMIKDPLPPELISAYSLYPIPEAFYKLHFPSSLEDTEKAVKRFKFEELFLFELIVALRKKEREKERKSPSLVINKRFTEPFLKMLPFELTENQKKVMKEIENDLKNHVSMHRLLQGDVGSGKTVVAIYAMLIAVENNKQACMMAPTEILAEQHYMRWKDILKSIGVTPGLLVGSLSLKEKSILKEKIRNKKIDIVFGTHALIEEGVEFAELSLVIVDEQHRFGVMQRAKLIAKGKNPHFLVMTATPIPRTLSITYYGDLEISELKEKPKVKAEVVTEVYPEKRKEEIYERIKKRIEEGEQVYVVCPLIEGSEKTELKSATEMFEEIKKVFGEEITGLVHGKMKTEDRISVMERFRKKDIKILVATTVIEVGVDVPHATMMVIFHPERFGLAQLHQLRGRIGRGGKKSYCILLLPPNISKEAKERIYYFRSTNDGFLLAEKDMEIRGPGELLGTRQHGFPDLKIADLSKDKDLLKDALKEAFFVVSSDPELKNYPGLKETIERRYKDAVKMIGVG